ncbi:MAG: hypothetical protein WBG70_18345 [Spirulinaceae cyanobacterium]
MIATSFFADKLISNSPILAHPDCYQGAKMVASWQVTTVNCELLLSNSKGKEEKYIFVQPSIFKQYADGTANLLGLVVNIDNPNKTWNLNIWFQTNEQESSYYLPEKEQSYSYQINEKHPVIFIGGGDYLGEILHLYENGSGLELSLSQQKNSSEISIAGSFGCIGVGDNCSVEIKANLEKVTHTANKNHPQKNLQIALPRVNNTNLLNFDSSTCPLMSA